MERKGVINGEASDFTMSNPWRRVVDYANYGRTWERTSASRPRYRLKAHDLKRSRNQPARGSYGR